MAIKKQDKKQAKPQQVLALPVVVKTLKDEEMSVVCGGAPSDPGDPGDGGDGWF